MADVLSDVIADVVPDALSDGGLGFSWPASTVAVYDLSRPSTVTITSSPDIDSIANLINPGTMDVSESTASKKPHFSTGPSSAEFDLTAARGLKTTDTLYSSTAFPTAFAIFKFVDNGQANRFQCAAQPGTPFIGWTTTYRATAGFIDVAANTVTAGILTASVSFAADGEYHLVRGTLRSSGVEVSIDGVTPTVASGANGGMAVDATISAIGTDTSDFGPSDGSGTIWAWLIDPTDDEIDRVEAYLLTRVP